MLLLCLHFVALDADIDVHTFFCCGSQAVWADFVGTAQPQHCDARFAVALALEMHRARLPRSWPRAGVTFGMC